MTATTVMMIGAGKYCIGHNSPFKTSRGKPMLGDDNNTMPAYHTCSSNSHKYTQKRPQELSRHSKHFKSHAKNFTDSFCALCMHHASWRRLQELLHLYFLHNHYWSAVKWPKTLDVRNNFFQHMNVLKSFDKFWNEWNFKCCSSYVTSEPEVSPIILETQT